MVVPLGERRERLPPQSPQVSEKTKEAVMNIPGPIVFFISLAAACSLIQSQKDSHPAVPEAEDAVQSAQDTPTHDALMQDLMCDVDAPPTASPDGEALWAHDRQTLVALVQSEIVHGYCAVGDLYFNNGVWKQDGYYLTGESAVV